MYQKKFYLRNEGEKKENVLGNRSEAKEVSNNLIDWLG